MMKVSHNYIRAEVERMPWPEIIPDESGDVEREIERLRVRVRNWRAFALWLLFALAELGASVVTGS